MATAVRATTSFVTTVKGEEHVVHAGDVLPADHPVVKEHPELFEEEATAARGERRRRSSPETSRPPSAS